MLIGGCRKSQGEKYAGAVGTDSSYHNITIICYFPECNPKMGTTEKICKIHNGLPGELGILRKRAQMKTISEKRNGEEKDLGNHPHGK